MTLDRRVAATLSPSTLVSPTTLGGGLAEMPFVVLGLFGGDTVSGAYGVGPIGITITGLRAYVMSPGTEVGKTATITLWKLPNGGAAVSTGVEVIVPTDAVAATRVSANYPMVEGDVLFSKIHLSDWILDAYHLSWVVEF